MKNIFIFRRDLRLEDNKALNLAFMEGDVTPIFIFDPKQVKDNEFKSDNVVQFMVTSLKELSDEISKLGGHLNVFYGDTFEVIKSLDGVATLSINLDYTTFAKERDKGISNICKERNIKINFAEDYLINSIKGVMNKSKPYKVFTPYYKAAKLLEVEKPFTEKKRFAKEKIVNKFSLDLANAKFFTFNDQIAVKGGRKEALQLLDKDYRSYGDIRNFPFLSTSRLSAHLKFGTISVREALNKLRSEELIRQIYWRDFWATITHFYPKVISSNFYEKFDNIPWKNKNFDAWKEGKTGFPIIDAGMRELNKTGWMHNRVRMLTASFLVKDLMVDWRLGAKYFAQKLVDYCPMQNQNNWQSVAGTGASALAWFRVMNPWLQQEKFDPECRYIKKWVEELKNIPTKDVHNWHAKYSEYNVYGHPIVDHKLQSKDFINSLKESFS